MTERERMVQELEKARAFVRATLQYMSPEQVLETCEHFKLSIGLYYHGLPAWWQAASEEALTAQVLREYHEVQVSEGGACEALGLDRLSFRQLYHDWLATQDMPRE